MTVFPPGQNVHPGDEVLYQVFLSNEGNVNRSDIPGGPHALCDRLPDGLTPLSPTGVPGLSASGNEVYWDGPIQAGETVTISIRAKVEAGASGLLANFGLLDCAAVGPCLPGTSLCTHDVDKGDANSTTDITVAPDGP